MNNVAEVIESKETGIVEFGEFDLKLAEYSTRYKGLVYDLTDPVKEKQAKSDKLAIGKVISSLDKAHKAKKGPLKEMVDLLDGERKRIKDGLLELQGDIKGQISKHDESIQAAKDELLRKASVFRDLREFEFPPTVDQVRERIDTINSTEIDDSYGEMKAFAALNKEESLQILVPMMAGLEAIAEKEAKAERERLEAEAKAKKEREDSIAREAKEEAERKAAEALERSEQATIKAEQDAKDAAERAEREKAEALERETKAKAKAEHDAKEAAEQARLDKAKAIAFVEQAAKEAAEQAESERLAAIEHDKAEQARREANTRHKGKINRAAADSLMKTAKIDEATALRVVTAIAKGHIPSVKIEY